MRASKAGLLVVLSSDKLDIVNRWITRTRKHATRAKKQPDVEK